MKIHPEWVRDIVERFESPMPDLPVLGLTGC